MKIYAVLLILCFSLSSQNTLLSQSNIFKNADNIALSGYDVVAYHNSHEAIRGSNDHIHKINGATFYFSNEANQKAFLKKPESYLPAYGGYCAFAMAMQGAKVPTDPTTFKIHNGKLYLFFNDYYEGKPFNTIVPWNQNELEMITKANTNWRNQ